MGGCMGTDNVPHPYGIDVEQADTSAWMASFAEHLNSKGQDLSRGDNTAQNHADDAAIAECVNSEPCNEEVGSCHDCARSGQLRIDPYAGFIPLIAGTPDARRIQRLLGHLSNPDEMGFVCRICSMSSNE